MKINFKPHNHLVTLFAFLVILFSGVLGISGCQPAGIAAQTESQLTGSPLITTNTPRATATPSPFELRIAEISQQTGLGDKTILGLSAVALVSLAISIIIMLLGSLVGWLAGKILRILPKLTPPKIDDRIAVLIEKPLRWLVILFALKIAISRLDFLAPLWKQYADLTIFALTVALFTHAAWKLVEFGLDHAFKRFEAPIEENLQRTLSPVLNRWLQAVIYLIGLGTILHGFGVNLSALFAVLGIGGVALSLAVKGTLEDMISGFLILVDQPFRIGDRIKTDKMDTWGDVVDIGARTTRIRTPDNRLVIIPNAVISRSTIDNYSVKDQSYMMTLMIGIAYNSDVEKAREIITQAIQSVPGLHETRTPSVGLFEYGDSALTMRAFYWLKSFKDIGLRHDVNRHVLEALEEAQIDIPNITYDINLIHKGQPDKDRPGIR